MTLTMKRLTIIIAFLLTAAFAQATPQEAQRMFNQGNEAYNAGRYDTAVMEYEACLKLGFESPELYYNLGNAYFRLNRMAPCILNYERAHALRPHDRETKQNLELAYSKTIDKIEPMPDFFITKLYYSVMGSLTARLWFIVALIVSTLFAVSLAGIFLATSFEWRKRFFVAAIILLLLTGMTSWMAFQSRQGAMTRHAAIVMHSPAAVKSAPDNAGVDKYILHEGAKVYIQDQLGQWYKVRLADGSTGWLQSNEIEEIF